MADSPTTRPSLLVRLRDLTDQAAWMQFVDVYGPLIYGYLRKQGLQDADAADVTQDVLKAVARVRAVDYDPGRGSFRGWLFTIVRNLLRNFRGRQHRPGRGAGDPAAVELLHAQPAPEADSDAAWECEYRRRTFAWAADQVRPQVLESTWQAFWRTAVDGQAPETVAQELHMPVASVYLAKSRIMARLKEQIRLMQAEESVSWPTHPVQTRQS
ncbi:MAG: sigma-70 family RNA polymerase sigma factor [Gemmataceae bacterium]|nr:sigma-70 family RNA polymerase sigma factor [Gemmataceae bacterium]